jgi:hypothetical protein
MSDEQFSRFFLRSEYRALFLNGAVSHSLKMSLYLSRATEMTYAPVSVSLS